MLGLGLFLRRAHELLQRPGFVVCALPPRLTRPGVITERTELLNSLLGNGYEIVSLDSCYLRYVVPPFEASAYSDLKDFPARPWRLGDLLVIRAGEKSIPVMSDAQPPIATACFARATHRFRVFFCPSRADNTMESWFENVEEFERTVSSRRGRVDEVGIWTTAKRGVRVRSSKVAQTILTAWQDGKSHEDAARALDLDEMDASAAVEQLESALQIWSTSSEAALRRTPEQLDDYRRKVISNLASQPSARRYEHVPDRFRLSFQRDRDRVLWSHALKLLGNKTQVFPLDGTEHVRHRLSHSVEVTQLAATIARAFGLDCDLTEAGAMAHDLGHTPFGHAGEHALSEIIKEFTPELGGFNHYEQGVDVVRWLEDVYSSESAGGFPGLNLTPETEECIFKHMYHRGNERLGQSKLLGLSKHQDFKDDTCHLEGQAVRIADKISYFISDLEDGTRMGAIRLEHLRQCKLFDRPPIDLQPAHGETLYHRFVAQRRSILQVLMEDVIVATDSRLARLGSLKSVRNTEEYTVNFSLELQREFSEVWRKIQAGVLHKDPRVIAANYTAARIMRDLFLLFACAPDLVPEAFRCHHESLKGSEYIKFYEGKIRKDVVGVPVARIRSLGLDRYIGQSLDRRGDNYDIPVHHYVMAKDYVASLTDVRARLAYERLIFGKY